MLGFAWLTLRQAREALKNGRLEEAQRLLGQSAARGHRRSWELYERLAQKFVERGERHLRQDNTEAAWTDLLRAEAMEAASSGAQRLRQSLVRLALAQVRAALLAAQPTRALEVLNKLAERSVSHPELPGLNEAARGWVQARELADRGDFAPALETVERLRRLLPGLPPLEEFRTELEKRGQALAALLLQLHQATAEGRWREVVELSDQVLQRAPQQREARKARELAWKAVEPPTVAVAPPPAPRKMTSPEPPHRFLLWIDGVGGYLVCLGARITLGQATPDTLIDVPVFADVSRLHASITRDSEGDYLLEAVRPVRLNGQPMQKTLLRSNDRITLGNACQLRFRQPSPISATARLDLVSGHRLPVAVDAVLLMADTLLLGPGPDAHVLVPDLKEPVVLFRHKEGLGIRHSGPLTVNGTSCRDRCLLSPAATVAGEDFALALEPVGTTLGRM